MGNWSLFIENGDVPLLKRTVSPPIDKVEILTLQSNADVGDSTSLWPVIKNIQKDDKILSTMG